MSPADIPNILKNQTVTYANVVVDHCPPKEDPNQIWITAGDNLITTLGSSPQEQRILRRQNYTGIEYSAHNRQIYVPGH
jgi:hypothetical protein